MRNRAILTLSMLVLAAALFSGCLYSNADEENIPYEQPLGETENEPSYTPYEPDIAEGLSPEQTSSPVAFRKMYFAPTKEDEIVIAPAYFELGGLSEGSLIDTWTSDGYLSVGKNIVGYRAGDPIGFVLYNNGVSQKQFKIEVVNAPEEVNWCQATEQSYQKAPDTIDEIVTLGTSLVTLESGQASLVIFSIELEEEVDYPEQWEFRFIVEPTKEGYQVGGGIRVFMYMR